MYELEVKVKTDHDAVRSKLAELDATQLSTVDQVDTYYDAPHRTFAETDEALRIRAETESNESSSAPDPVTQLTYKGPLVDDASKTRTESETEVESRETMEEILDHLGFSPAAVVEKSRERYALDGYTVTLDTVSNLGEFVEVETEVEADHTNADFDTAREGAFSILRALGLDPDEQIRTSYLDLLINDN
ncbi:class IV adenylate cyclase [Halocatena marina]|uniref:Class IV adenylate cyclase n=1 Tax=Halocatena marina TaxID=2934937 RepID=A0ABD5YWL9_9EURY|nr:class IV adenylate cyclase [Halocatena marina]